MKRIFSTCLFTFLLTLVLAPDALFPAVIKGVVKDHRKQPVGTVVVMVKNTRIAAITGLNGKFSVTVPDNRRTVTLVFDRDGYHPYEERITVSGRERSYIIPFIPTEAVYEKVSVTAMNQEESSISIPMAETSVSSLEIQEKISESIVETLSDTAGVHFIGKGGYAVTPSIRGLARRRVLVLVDGVRVTSDRRVGASASFVPPEIARRIEVVRSAASVLYGSDAIGGVVNILSRPTDHDDQANLRLNALNLNLNSVNKRVNAGFTYGLDKGPWHAYTGFQYARADDYASPDKTIVNSGYRYYSGIFDISRSDEHRDIYLGYVGGFGRDIGKPERDNDPHNYSFVPKEGDHIFRLGYNERQWIKDGSFHVSLFLNPTTYVLDKISLAKSTFQRADTRSLNMGFKTYLRKSLGKALSVQVGAEWFARRNLRVELQDEAPRGVITSFPMDNGSRNDYSAFLTLKYALTPTFDIDGGIRYTFFSIGADVDGVTKEKKSDSASYYLGLIKKLSPSISLFCNVGRAFRFPSLSESFYTGITGRKYVVGNPLLEAESSLNVDAGLKIASKKYFIGIYAFSYGVDHLIERYKNDEGLYTFDNIQKGRIQGGEIEVQWSPVKDINLFGHYFYYHGRSAADDEPLNDIPAPRLFVGGKIFLNRFWIEGNYLHSFKKKDPGPAEIENAAYDLLNLKGGYYLSSALFIYMKVSNLLNKTYYANPDPDIPEAKGLSFSAGFHFYF